MVGGGGGGGAGRRDMTGPGLSATAESPQQRGREEQLRSLRSIAIDAFPMSIPGDSNWTAVRGAVQLRRGARYGTQVADLSISAHPRSARPNGIDIRLAPAWGFPVESAFWPIS